MNKKKKNIQEKYGTYNLHFDNIVIGADLSALLYSFYNKYPFFYLRKIPNFKHEKVNTILGTNPDKVYDHLMCMLSLGGYNTLLNDATTLSIKNDNLLVAVTKSNNTYNVNFNHAFIFDPYEVGGLDAPTVSQDCLNEVVDYFKIKSCRKFIDPIIEDKENTFCEKVIFYERAKKCAKSINKEIMTVSRLTDSELLMPDFNETMSKMKTLKMMKSIGMTGRISGKRNHYGEKVKILRRLEIEFVKREVKRLQKETMQDLNTIKFIDIDPSEIHNICEVKESIKMERILWSIYRDMKYLR